MNRFELIKKSRQLTRSRLLELHLYQLNLSHTDSLSQARSLSKSASLLQRPSSFLRRTVIVKTVSTQLLIHPMCIKKLKTKDHGMQDGGNNVSRMYHAKRKWAKVKSCGGYQLLPLQSANNAVISIKRMQTHLAVDCCQVQVDVLSQNV